MNLRACLLDSFQTAIGAANPAYIVPRYLPDPSHVSGRVFVVGAGKASAAMALAVEKNWPENKVLEGIVVTRYGYGLPMRRIRLVEAGHPVPDKNGLQAAQIIMKQVSLLTKDDLLLCLFSGGGSSLLSLPPEDITLADLQKLTQQLLRCGASIQEINAVRKHLSCIQGGWLAAASRAPVHALMISDVTGDDPTHIASGPCAPDPTHFSDALSVLEQYQLDVPPSIRNRLIAGDRLLLDETPKPGSAFFKHVENIVIASAHQSLTAAKKYLQKQYFNTLILGDTVTGEAREVAKVYAAFIKEIRKYPDLLKPPAALLSGGETTVTVKGSGRGGRNTEFLLSLLIELGGLDDIYALACDTDGVDGSESNAGALITPGALTRARNKGIQADQFLADNDSYHFFEQMGDLVITGPTYTNVNDYRVVLIV
ncbi:glycerate kinase [Nitrosomonas sp.]|uniref:glycerate kinase type-2 family protein n=1 Tax=Nitrosomonas sp. TaxID=42353 RepID=UPI001D2EEB17|nr:glycerate kinase [Nitrosomonas sp.]MCB1950191.1 glycerate kinase [Nitrosomonas sp.]MCP5243729.1 glycerate kinase [Burkholderiales bacterium]MDR4513563.1 glycerate kinase [Nitrosomonas sp.]